MVPGFTRLGSKDQDVSPALDASGQGMTIHPGRSTAGSARQSRLASSRARAITASSIDGVSRPVNVFCWLGWYEPSST